MAKSSQVASASQDGQVAIWSQETPGQPWKRHVLCEVGAVVWCVAWSLSSELLAVQAAGQDVVLWQENNRGKWERLGTADEMK